MDAKTDVFQRPTDPAEMYYQSFVSSAHPYESRPVTSLDVSMVTTGREREIPLDLSVKQPSRPENFLLFEQQKLAALRASGLSHRVASRSVYDPSIFHLNSRPYGEEYTTNSSVNVMPTATSLCSRKHSLASTQGRPQPASPVRYSTAGKVQFRENGDPCSAALAPPYVDPHTPVSVQRLIPTDTHLGTNIYRQAPNRFMNVSSPAVYEKREDFLATTPGGNTQSVSNSSLDESQAAQFLWRMKCSATPGPSSVLRTTQTPTSSSFSRTHDSWISWTKERNCASVENHPVGLTMKSYYSSLGGLARLEDDMGSRSSQLYQSSPQEMYREQQHGTYDRNNESLSNRNSVPPDLNSRFRSQNSKNTANEVIVIDDDPQPPHVSYQENQGKYESGFTQPHVTNSGHHLLPTKRPFNTEDNEANVSATKMPRLVAFHGNKSYESETQTNLVLYPDPPALTAAVVTIATTTHTGMLNVTTHCSSSKVAAVHQAKKGGGENYVSKDSNYFSLPKTLQYEGKEQGEMTFNLKNISQKQPYHNINDATIFKSLTSDAVQNTRRESKSIEDVLQDGNVPTPSVVESNLLPSDVKSIDQNFYSISNQPSGSEVKGTSLCKKLHQVSSTEVEGISSLSNATTTISQPTATEIGICCQANSISQQKPCYKGHEVSFSSSVSSSITHTEASSKIPGYSCSSQASCKPNNLKEASIFNNLHRQIPHTNLSNENVPNKVLLPHDKPYTNKKETYPLNVYSRQVFCSDSKDKSLFSPVSHQVLHTVSPIHHKVTATETKSESLLSRDHHRVYCNKTKPEFHQANRIEANNKSLLNPLPHADTSFEPLIRTDYHMISRTEANNGPLLNPVLHQMLHTDTNSGSLDRAHHQVLCCDESNELSNSTHRQIVHTNANSWSLLQPTYCNVPRAEANKLHEPNVALHQVTRLESNSVPVFNSSSQAPHVKTTNMPIFNSVSHQLPTHVANRRPFFNNKNLQTQNVEISRKQSLGNTSYPVLYTDDSKISYMKNASHQAPITESTRTPLSNVSSYQTQRNETNMTPLANSISHQGPSTETTRRPLSNISSHQIQRNETNMKPLANNMSHQLPCTETPRTPVSNVSSYQMQRNETNMKPLANNMSHQVPCTENTRTPLSNVASHQVQSNEINMTPLANNISHQVPSVETNRTSVSKNTFYQISGTEPARPPLSNSTSLQIQRNEARVSPLPNTNYHQIQHTEAHRTQLFNAPYKFAFTQAHRPPLLDNTVHQDTRSETNKSTFLNNASYQGPRIWASGSHQPTRNDINRTVLSRSSNHDLRDQTNKMLLLNKTNGQISSTEASRNIIINNSFCKISNKEDKNVSLLNPEAHQIFSHPQTSCTPVLNSVHFNQSSPNENTSAPSRYRVLNSRSENVPVWKSTENQNNGMKNKVYGKFMYRSTSNNSFSTFTTDNKLQKSQASCTVASGNTQSTIITSRPSSEHKRAVLETSKMGAALLDTLAACTLASSTPISFTTTNRAAAGNQNYSFSKDSAEASIGSSEDRTNEKDVSTAETGSLSLTIQGQLKTGGGCPNENLEATKANISSTPILVTTTNGAAAGNQNYYFSKDSAKASTESSEDRTNEKDVSTAEAGSLSLTIQGQLRTGGGCRSENLEATKANSSSVSNSYAVVNTNTKALLNSTVLHKLLSSAPSQLHLPDNSLPMSISHTNCKRGPNIGQSPLKIKNSKGGDEDKWRQEIRRKRPMMQDLTKDGCQDRCFSKRKSELVTKQNQSVQPNVKPKQERKSVQPTVKRKSQNQSVKHSVKSKQEHQPVQSSARPKQDLRKITRKKQEFPGFASVDSLTKNKHVNTRAQQHRHQFVDFQPRVLGARTRTQTGRNGNLTFRSHRNSNKSINTRKRNNKIIHEANTERRLRNHLLTKVYKEENSSEEENIAKKTVDENSKLGVKVTKANITNFRRPSTWHSKRKKQTGRQVARRKRLKSGLDMIPKPYKKRKAKLVKPEQPINKEVNDEYEIYTTVEKNKEEKSRNKYNKFSFDFPNGAPPEMKRLVVNKALGETILHRAARLGYMEVVLYCLETNYCDVNARDNAGYTPLHECCSRGNLEIANALVLFGSDVSASAVGGIRPLHDAVENDQLEIVRLLLSHGADPMIATYSGLTPIKLSKSAVMEEFLKDYMSDVTGETSYNTCINSWQFPGSAVCLDLEEVGYDIWEGLPLESENEDKDKDDFLFEVSDTPHLPTFRLQLPCNDNKVLSNCLRLNDVLRQIGLTKDEFVQFYRNIKIFSIPRHEFEGSATCRQFMAGTKLDSEDNGKATIDVLCLNSDIREVLGIELVTLR